MYDQIKSKGQPVYTMLASRRIGKSFTLCVLASEVCLQNPNSIVKYICPKQKMVRTIIKPIMEEIYKDAPPELKPEFKTNDNLYMFPNGSQIQIAGTDNGNHENIRGGKSDLWIIDEAGFCDELDYVVNSILMPTTDTTGGIGILASTPSKRADHKFIKDFVEKAETAGKLLKYTLYDNPMMTPDKIKEIENRYVGGKNNPEFRREYKCEIIRESEDTVVPEFDSDTEKLIVRTWERPKFFDYYLSMDIGGKDYTVILFAYYDFVKNKLIIEDELVLREKQHSGKIAKGIKEKQDFLYGEKPPYLMYADNNNVILLNDLQLYHGLNFLATQKTNKEAFVNQLRLKIQNEEIIIHPRCTTLIAHLKHATWAKTTGPKGYREFARSTDYGHYDAVDALIYLTRNIIYGKNPYPAHYGALSPDSHHIRPKENTGYDGLKRIFKVNKSRGN